MTTAVAAHPPLPANLLHLDVEPGSYYWTDAEFLFPSQLLMTDGMGGDRMVSLGGTTDLFAS